MDDSSVAAQGAGDLEVSFFALFSFFWMGDDREALLTFTKDSLRADIR